MSLENIIQKIIQDAGAEAEKIVQESTQKGESIKEEARKEAKTLGEKLIKDEERAASLDAHRLVTQARLEKRLHILSLKKKLVDEVLEQAFKMAGAENRTLTKTIILKDGEKKESYDRERLKAELRPLLENEIVKVLKI